MKYLLTIVVLISITFSACQKNPLWVGKKEFTTYQYRYMENGDPEISEQPTNHSPFVEVGSAKAIQAGEDNVVIVLDGIRVSSNQNNFIINEITISENDGNGWDVQNEFSSINTSTDVAVDVAAVLVLDMSSSLVELIPDIKTYAKGFVDKIVAGTPDSKVAVIFFSSKSAIYQTEFYSADNADILKAEIDDFNNSTDRTALFDATQKGITMLDDLVDFEGSKALVVFTDGGDNDTDNPSSVKSKIEDNDYFRICIGLKGNDFDKSDLKTIASTKNNYIVVKEDTDLEDAFKSVAGQVSSVYKIEYERSGQLLEDFIDIKFEYKVEKLGL